jgi:hypothetical protein
VLVIVILVSVFDNLFNLFTYVYFGARGSVMVEALCYRSEGRKFEDR